MQLKITEELIFISRVLCASYNRFGTTPVHVGFMVDKVVLEQVFVESFSFLLLLKFHRCSVPYFTHPPSVLFTLQFTLSLSKTIICLSPLTLTTLKLN